MAKIKKFCFDLDGVICNLVKDNDYKLARPIKKNIKKINELYDLGHYILIFTARYMGRNNDEPKIAIKQGYRLTEKQLKKWKVSYSKLLFGKPSFDILIDDKSIFYKKNWHLYL
tara:strand:+ start:533 stop:874 length:342 start_codon:yes stop_codon:yes gene_type:complete